MDGIDYEIVDVLVFCTFHSWNDCPESRSLVKADLSSGGFGHWALCCWFLVHLIYEGMMQPIYEGMMQPTYAGAAPPCLLHAAFAASPAPPLRLQRLQCLQPLQRLQRFQRLQRLQRLERLQITHGCLSELTRLFGGTTCLYTSKPGHQAVTR